MTCLEDYPVVQKNLKSSKKDSITALHKFVYHSEGDRGNRKRLRQFTGFEFSEENEQYAQLTQYVKQNLSTADLTSICGILGLKYQVQNLQLHIFQNLLSGQLLANANDEEEEATDDEEDEEILNNVNADDNQLANNDDNQSVRTETSRNSIQRTVKSSAEYAAHERVSQNRNTSNMARFTMNFRDIEESVRTFDGTGSLAIETWIEEFDETAEIMQWDDFQRFVFAKKVLKGIAALFIKSERGITTWPKLRSALQNEFRSTTNSAKIHKELSERKMRKDESHQEYFLCMKELAKRGKIEDAALIQYVIDGINDLNVNKIVLYGANDQKEFKEKLKCYETIREKDKGQQDVKTNFRKPLTTNKPNHSSNSRGLFCYNCGIKGHSASNCLNKEKGVKCFKCNTFGHYAKECTKQSTEQRSNTKLVEVTNNFMMKKVTLQNKPINALFDTGSKFNLLNEDVFIKFDNKQLTPTTITLMGFGNRTPVSPLGRIQSEIVIDNESYKVNMLVVEKQFLNVDLVIGEEFCKDKEVNINQDGIHFSKSSKTVETEIEKTAEVMMINVTDENEIDIDLNASKESRQQVHELISNYKPTKIKDTKVQMTITVKDETPIFSRPNRLPIAERKIVDDQIEEWLRQGIIEPSDSEFCSPVILVKKRDGTPRLCIDYRKVNRVIVKDRFPLPLIEDQIDRLKDVMFCSTIDLKNGFFHVTVAEGSRKYTSFVTHSGQYQFIKVPFGLCNSPSVFQRHINAVFRELTNEGVALPYVDDVIIPAPNEEKAVQNLKRVVKVCEEYGLELNIKKCHFLKRKVEFLGHVIENKTIAPSPSKVEALIKYKAPENVKQVQSFLGLAGYFRKFIPNFSLIAKPLSDLIRKDVKFEFIDKHKQAFSMLKEAMCRKPVLGIFDPSLETEVHTDASSDGFGAVLMQRLRDDNELHPIYFMSKKTSDAERKYSSYELEILAVIEALKKFRVYLLGRHFKIITDCNAFTKTLQKKDLCTRVARWIMLLEEYDYVVEHRSGSGMKHVDALSRYAVLQIDEANLLTKIQFAQQNDDELKTIINILRENHTCSDYFLKGNILYKQTEDCDLVVVPRGMQGEVIRQTHDRGHFGVQKVKDMIAKEFYIPKLEDKIRRQIACCVKCVIVNRKKGRQEGELHPLEKGETPLVNFHIDFVGPLETTSKRYKHILVVVDAFTKFCWLYPTRTTSAACVITKLQNQSTIFGNPAHIITDRGAAFTSDDFKTYCETEGIKHSKITTGLPRANGQVERLNAVVATTLAKLASDEPEKWYKYVEKVQTYINSSTSRSTGFTPFELLTGVKMRTKEDLRIKTTIETEMKQQFNQDRDEMRERAKTQILKTQQENRRTYNLRRKPATRYLNNDLVAVKRTQLGPGLKLKAKYLGPYRIVKVKANNTYDVEKIGSGEGPLKTTTCAEFIKPWPNVQTEDDDIFEGEY